MQRVNTAWLNIVPFCTILRRERVSRDILFNWIYRWRSRPFCCRWTVCLTRIIETIYRGGLSRKLRIWTSWKCIWLCAWRRWRCRKPLRVMLRQYGVISKGFIRRCYSRRLSSSSFLNFSYFMCIGEWRVSGLFLMNQLIGIAPRPHRIILRRRRRAHPSSARKWLKTIYQVSILKTWYWRLISSRKPHILVRKNIWPTFSFWILWSTNLNSISSHSGKNVRCSRWRRGSTMFTMIFQEIPWSIVPILRI